jgi:hypothetical protein
MTRLHALPTGTRDRVGATSQGPSGSRPVQRCGIGSTCDCAQEQQEAGVKRDISAATADGGSPIPEAHRVAAEEALRHDFSAVRIHAGPAADQVASRLHAHALTVGTDVLFRSADFRPETSDGNRLLHHELAHVAQQAHGLAGSWIDGGRSDPLEMAADRAAEQVLAFRHHDAGGGAGERSGDSVALASQRPRIQRQLFFSEVPIPEIGFEELGPEFGFRELGPEVGAPDIGAPDIGAPDIGAPDIGAPDIGAPDIGGPDISVPEPLSEPGLEPAPNVAPDPGLEPFPPVMPAPPEDTEDDEEQKCGSAKLPFTVVTWSTGPQGQGGAVKASPLTRCSGNTVGSIARREVYQAQFDCIVNTGKTPAERQALGRRWVAAHLLHGISPRPRSWWRNLHGPGNQAWNLVIADSVVNTRMNSFVEGPILSLVYGQNRTLWYEVHVAEYWPDSPFVAKAITVSYGLYDTATGSEGPTLQSQSIYSQRRPPACPATPVPGTAAPPAAVVPPAASVLPGPPPDFTSTVSICYQVLTSRTFPVKDGGLTVALAADWVPASGGSQCSAISEYTVTLKQKGLIFDSTISETNFPVGKKVTMPWRYLDAGDYYLVISVPDHDPTCCLQGGIAVSTFSAARPSRRIPIMA